MKKVRDTDCRSLDHKTPTELRRRAVAQVLGGESPEAVARALGINRTTIYDWLALYRKGEFQVKFEVTGRKCFLPSKPIISTMAQPHRENRTNLGCRNSLLPFHIPHLRSARVFSAEEFQVTGRKCLVPPKKLTPPP